MYCSNCGVQNSEGATHCVNCGSVLMDTLQQAVAQAVSVMTAQPKTCGLAIASLVMGILSLFCSLFMAIPAIICGIIALVKISNNKHSLKGTGMAITGIVIPSIMLILLPIIAMILAIMMPALSKVKHIAQREVCGVNLKGLSIAMVVYASDYDGTFPSENWCDLLIEEADVSPKSFICPESDAIEGESSYAMNEDIAGMKLAALPANVVLFFETDKGIENGIRNFPLEIRRYYTFLNPSGNVLNENTKVYKDRFNQFGGPEDVTLRHVQHDQLGCNIVFTDGHIEFVTEDQIGDLKWTVE